jgi:hypothetical protein
MPDAIVNPYEQTLNTMAKQARIGWAEQVRAQLIDLLRPGTEVILLAGMRYREGIEAFLREHGFSVTVPLKGLSLGRQLAWLKLHETHRNVV